MLLDHGFWGRKNLTRQRENLIGERENDEDEDDDEDRYEDKRDEKGADV